MPTLCSLAGCKFSRDLKWDGADISKLLLNDAKLNDRPIYTVGPSWKARALRFGDWKLVVHGEGNSRKTELFDIVRDPAETKNLAETDSLRLDKMLSMLEAVATADRDAMVKD
jgi:arylsulfatase A-like enzyme